VTQKQTSTEAGQSLKEVASTLFGTGFFVGDALREELRAEAPLRLAYALGEAGVHPDSLHALALAVREVGDAEPLKGQETEKLTDKQRKMIEGMIAEKGLPGPFREILQSALPKLTQRRDLAVLYGMLTSAYERMGRIEAVKALPVEPTAPAAAPKRR
jgi:hypothetical protein